MKSLSTQRGFRVGGCEYYPGGLEYYLGGVRSLERQCVRDINRLGGRRQKKNGKKGRGGVETNTQMT